MTAPTFTYPQAKREPVQETIGGITFEDAYEWLEEDSPETLAWQEAQTEITERYVREWVGFNALRDRLAQVYEAAEVAPVIAASDRWFRLAPPSRPDEQAILRVASSPTDEGQPLVDPNTLNSGVPTTVDWFRPSPRGTYVVYGLSQHGDEQSVLHVIETETGRVLPVRVPHTMQSNVGWLPDESGFFFSGSPSGETAAHQLYFHRLGDEGTPERQPIDNAGLSIMPIVSRDGRYVVALTGDLEPRPYYVKSLPDGEWRPFLRDVPGIFVGGIEGDRFIAVQRNGYPRGRLVSIPLDSGTDTSTWEELLPESDVVLQGAALVAGKIVLSEMVEAQSRISILALDGTREGEVPLPGPGSVGYGVAAVWSPPFQAEEETITFPFTSFTTSPALYRYHVAEGRLEQLTEAGVNRTDITARQEWCKSKDGTRVPYWIVHRTDLDTSGPQPTFIHAYAGFNFALLPAFNAEFLGFVDAGGIFVQPNPRGGSELGSDWWRSGRMETKQNTFDDVYAVAEALFAANLTTSDLLAFTGASNGGMLSGVMITQRPDLFRAVVPVVPLLDLMRVGRDSYALIACAMEYGDPKKPEEAAATFRYSPYHSVREGVAYPAVMSCAGASDVRCPLWHSRKFVAALQHATTSDRPILLRPYQDVGHGSGFSPAARSEASAERLSFVLQQLGMSASIE